MRLRPNIKAPNIKAVIGALALALLAGCVSGTKAVPSAALRSGCDKKAVKVVKQESHDLVLDVCGVYEDWHWNALNGWVYVGRSAVQPPPPDSDGDGLNDAIDACPKVAGPAGPDASTNGCPPPPDADGDGIADGQDACPDKAGVADADVKKNGCPADRDGDGVADAGDACPDVAGAANTEAAKNGCPPDQDGDGVADAVDACADVAGNPSSDAKLNGCPDKDGDGILDQSDACPDQAGTPNEDQAKNGCPVPPGPNTGIAECDAYLVALQACADNLPEAKGKTYKKLADDTKKKIEQAGADEAKKKQVGKQCQASTPAVQKNKACAPKVEPAAPPKPPEPSDAPEAKPADKPTPPPGG